MRFNIDECTRNSTPADKGSRGSWGLPWYRVMSKSRVKLSGAGTHSFRIYSVTGTIRIGDSGERFRMSNYEMSNVDVGHQQQLGYGYGDEMGREMDKKTALDDEQDVDVKAGHPQDMDVLPVGEEATAKQ